MFMNRLQKSVAIRAAICLLLLSMADLLLFEDRWIILFGLAIGTAISILKFYSYGLIFKNNFKIEILGSDIKQTVVVIVVFLINQVVLFSALFLSYLHNPWTFLGLAAGVLSVPFVLLVNTVTEVLGITKNRFFV